jgi:Mrp family chromosome partitioning ATPase
MPKKRKEDAPAPSCPSGEGKPDADAQYEAFKRKNEEAKLLQKTFKGIKNIIVVLSGKGGVGKSTVATNLAAAFASKGKTVGILDADVTGPDIPKMLGLEGQKAKVSEKAEPVGEMLAPIVGPLGIKAMSSSFLLQSSDQAVVWRGPMKMGLIKEFFMHVDWGELDYLIIDLPPGTSDEPLTIAQLVKPCTGVVIVTTPQEVSLLKGRDLHKAPQDAYPWACREHVRVHMPALRQDRGHLQEGHLRKSCQGNGHTLPGLHTHRPADNQQRGPRVALHG